MKNVIALILIAVFAFAGVQLADAASYQRQTLRSDTAIGGTANTTTVILSMEAMCEKGPLLNGAATDAPCYFGIRKYSDVSTGPVLDDDVYFVSVSGGTHTFNSTVWGGQVKNVFPNGAYFDSITGTVNVHFEFLK